MRYKGPQAPSANARSALVVAGQHTGSFLSLEQFLIPKTNNYTYWSAVWKLSVSVPTRKEEGKRRGRKLENRRLMQVTGVCEKTLSNQWHPSGLLVPGLLTLLSMKFARYQGQNVVYC